MKNEEMKLKEIKCYYATEETKIYAHYFINENGERHGIFKTFYENGEVKSERNYENGELLKLNYFQKSERNYENGELLKLNYFQLFKKWIKKLLNKI